MLLTAPYFHDGRAKTVEEAAELMMKGGIPNPHRDAKLKAWPVTPQQRKQLLAFLRSLTPEGKPYPRPDVPSLHSQSLGNHPGSTQEEKP
jgi:cytochrome c peroxidase